MVFVDDFVWWIDDFGYGDGIVYDDFDWFMFWKYIFVIKDLMLYVSIERSFVKSRRRDVNELFDVYLEIF